jgi:hypothetical protein
MVPCLEIVRDWAKEKRDQFIDDINTKLTDAV